MIRTPILSQVIVCLKLEFPPIKHLLGTITRFLFIFQILGCYKFEDPVTISMTIDYSVHGHVGLWFMIMSFQIDESRYENFSEFYVYMLMIFSFL